MFYVVPSVVALVVKVVVLILTREPLKRKKHRDLAWFLLSLLLLNSAEVTQYFFLSSPHEGAIIIKLYWCFALSSLYFLLLHCLKIARYRCKHLSLLKIIMITTTVLILKTDFIIKGAESIGYALTAIPGDFFPVAKITAVGLILSVMAILIHAGMKHPQLKTKRKCMVLIAALLPSMLAGLFIIALMSIGIKVNAAVIMPCTITFFIGMLLLTEHRYGLFGIFCFIPTTREHQLYKAAWVAINQVICEIENEKEIELKSVFKNLEAVVIAVVIAECDNNKTLAAKRLSMARSTLHSKT